MKTFKYTILVAALCFGLTSFANATLTQVIGPGPGGSWDKDNGGPTNENPDTVTAFFIAQTGDTDATHCLRTGDEGVPVTGTFDLAGGATVTISSPATGVADISFNLTGQGQVICGFWIFGGSNAFLYTVSADEGVTGSFEIHTPEAGKSGTFAGISHIDIFCCPSGTTAPDSGTTAML